MRDLLILVWAMVCGILLAYSDGAGALLLSLCYLLILAAAQRAAKPGRLPLLLGGVILGLSSAALYNAPVSLENKYYVNASFQARVGIRDVFLYQGRKLAVDQYAVAFGQRPYAGELLYREPVRLMGRFSSAAYDLNGEVLHAQDVTVERGEEVQHPLSRLDEFKKELAQGMREEMGSEAGSLAASLVLGVKDDALRERTELLKYLGIIHILSISGFHVNLLEALLKRGGLKRFSLAIIVLYALLVNSVPAWRAALMKLSKGLGRLLKRDSSADNQLLFAALLQLLSAPYLLFNKSFQLTYAATLGLIFFSRPLSQWLVSVPGGKIKAGFILSLSAMLPCIPILALFQPDINLALFPANLLIVPFYSLFCVLAFFAIPPLLLRLHSLTALLAFFMDLALRIIRFLEYFAAEFLSLRVAWTGAAGLFLLGILAIAAKVYGVSLGRRIAVLAAGCFLISNLSFLPGSTRVSFSKSMGQARVILQKDLWQREFVTKKMHKRGQGRRAIAVEEPMEALGLILKPAPGDFPAVFYGAEAILPKAAASSDIIDEEYLIFFGNLIRLK